jgi:phosphoribosyl 1,2-cyclic phosphodiesterase
VEIKIYGNRGSIPVPGEQSVKYGGNTPCIRVCDDSGNNYLILDAGSGIRELGNEIVRQDKIKNIDIIITHSHWDHIQGLPFFKPLYTEDFFVNVYAPGDTIKIVEDIINIQMLPKYFPVGPEVFKAKIKYFNIEEGTPFEIKSFKLTSIQNHHSPGTFSYKIFSKGKNFVYMTDNEIYFEAEKRKNPELEIVEELNKELIDFCKETDLLIHDIMYSPEDYKERIGWGHSCTKSTALFASLVNPKKLMFFHYDPDYSDRQIDGIIQEAQDIIGKLNHKIESMPSMQDLTIRIR